MISYRRQKGIGSLGWLVILALAGFGLMCLFRLGPAYWDNRYIVTALKSLSKKPDLTSMTKNEINTDLRNFATINGVRGDEAGSFKIIRKKDRMIVNSVYEKRVHLFFNIDVVMSFKNQLDSSNPEACCKYLINDEPIQ